jgi:hypothetical protein
MGKSYAECAAAIDISTTSFANKINGKSKFYIDELERLGNFLRMTPEERNNIFLN